MLGAALSIICETVITTSEKNERFRLCEGNSPYSMAMYSYQYEYVVDCGTVTEIRLRTSTSHAWKT